MARFRSRDNQKKVGLSFVSKQVIITTYTLLLQLIIIISHLHIANFPQI